MKSLYIIAFVLLSFNMYAQENKTSEQQDQTVILKNVKEHEAQILKETQEKASKKPVQSGLASDQGLEVKKQESKAKPQADNSGKLIPNTASFDEVLATIPNRKSSRKANNSGNTNMTTAGLPNTATLQEIKKTIPKN
ncbi:hypothetical protein [Chryseobacterium paridis]|uniref:Uncharacterized protein n=1 Tax=Chryseobacterium paridis TaxID=2800328 RepID=A0ABS1FQG5_9FLAO|nr:hypothetical protein [Chryseobacterium paridis]MBK1894643.1 hypothetical protein [Chryseobacterium paridis]